MMLFGVDFQAPQSFCGIGFGLKRLILYDILGAIRTIVLYSSLFFSCLFFSPLLSSYLYSNVIQMNTRVIRMYSTTIHNSRPKPCGVGRDVRGGLCGEYPLARCFGLFHCAYWLTGVGTRFLVSFGSSSCSQIATRLTARTSFGRYESRA